MRAISAAPRRDCTPRDLTRFRSGAPGLAIALVILCAARAEPQTRPPARALGDAVAAGLVTAEFRTTGRSAGDVIRATLRKSPDAPAGPLRLTLEPGTILRSTQPKEQNMVVASVRGIALGERRMSPRSEIVLADLKPRTYVLEGYCAEFAKADPAATTRLMLHRADPTLTCVLTQAKARGLNPWSIQAAVFIVTDRVTYAELNPQLPMSPEDWNLGSAIATFCMQMGVAQTPVALGSESFGVVAAEGSDAEATQAARMAELGGASRRLVDGFSQALEQKTGSRPERARLEAFLARTDSIFTGAKLNRPAFEILFRRLVLASKRDIEAMASALGAASGEISSATAALYLIQIARLYEDEAFQPDAFDLLTRRLSALPPKMAADWRGDNQARFDPATITLAQAALFMVLEEPVEGF